MTDEIHIRPATLQDAEAIAFVQMRTWQISYAGIFPAERLASLDLELELRIERWTSILSGTDRLTVAFVAETNRGEIIGFANAGKQVKPDFPQDAEVFAIYLLPDHHGKKIGRCLFAAAADKLQKLGFTTLLVWVLAKNLSSRGFYEHLGGRFCGEDEYLRWGQSYKLTAYCWDSLALPGE